VSRRADIITIATTIYAKEAIKSTNCQNFKAFTADTNKIGGNNKYSF
jgi:hypothetical protein